MDLTPETVFVFLLFDFIVRNYLQNMVAMFWGVNDAFIE